MKNILLISFLFFVAALNAQSLTVLIVDDSNDDFLNTQFLADAIDSSGYDVTYFDAYGDGLNPDLETLNLFDLVVWHTSGSGVGLYFWDLLDTTNVVLQTYLEQPTANLWLIGNDFMYDRYGSPSVDFVEGDFPYDYLGIATYEAQSYGDDESVGVPFVSPVEDQPILGIQNLNWIFPTLWWADAFVPRAEATSIYQFDGDEYPLAGRTTGIYYETSYGSRVLTYGFDLALVDEYDNVKNHMGSVLDWWSGLVATSNKFQLTGTSLSAAPNAFRNQVTLSIRSDETLNATLDIYSFTGQRVARLLDQTPILADVQKDITWTVPSYLPAGTYFCRLQDGQRGKTIKLLKQ